jgi:hypothetical protein
MTGAGPMAMPATGLIDFWPNHVIALVAQTLVCQVSRDPLHTVSGHPLH